MFAASDGKWGKSPDFEGAGVFSGSMGSCLGVSESENVNV